MLHNCVEESFQFFKEESVISSFEVTSSSGYQKGTFFATYNLCQNMLTWNSLQILLCNKR